MNEKKLKERKKRALKLSKKLEEIFPKTDSALNYKNPLQLLVATMLSAQSTDKKINEITQDLFKKYKSVDDFANVNQKDLEKDIKSSGFYKNKAKNIIASAKKIKKDYSGKVPKKMEELISLPGVARKTANIVTQKAYGRVEGIPVDTHMKRFAKRFDLTDYDNPDKIERDLMEILPKEEWNKLPYRAVKYGREIAPSRGKYEPEKDSLVKIYPPAGNK